MKVQIVEDENILEDEVIIKCKKNDENITEIAKMIEHHGLNLIGIIDSERYFVNLTDIFYFEAVDNKVFAYTAEQVYQVNYKITELVEEFSKLSFIQISRTVVLNIDKIDHVLSLINGRILAVLINKEKQIITRAYADDFKEKIKYRGEKR